MLCGEWAIREKERRNAAAAAAAEGTEIDEWEKVKLRPSQAMRLMPLL
jgi:hypothetical protein